MGVLSIDFGTSNTVAVWSGHGRPPTVLELDGSVSMPSAVFAATDGTLIVGREAQRRARIDPSRFEPNPKRRIDEGTLLLGDRVVPVVDVIAAVLGRVHVEVVRALGGAAPDEVRLTHPAKWGPRRREVLLAAARQAGLVSVVLIPEPVAAAAHFASLPGAAVPGALAVYDLGAGTFDVGIVGAGGTVLAAAGLDDFGGLDIDHALVEHVGRQVAGRDPATWHRLTNPVSTEDRRAARLLWEDVRAAKEALSGHPQTEVALPPPFGDVLVTRDELEAAVRQRLLHSVHLLGSTVAAAGLSTSDLTGVYLVGGSSRMPLAAKLITEELGIVASSLDLPETAVALGAHLLPGATPPPVQPVAPSPRPAPPVKQPATTTARRRRLPRPVFVAIVVVIGAVVTLLLSHDWDGPNGGGGGGTPTTGNQDAGLKYDPAALPTCRPVGQAISSTGNDDQGGKAAPNGTTELSCDFAVLNPDATGVVKVQALPAVVDGKTSQVVASELYFAATSAEKYHSADVTFGEHSEVSSTASGSTCQSADLVLLDANVVLTVTYEPRAADVTPGDCETNVAVLAHSVYDAIQPK